jgi:hypothetical protein
MMDVAKRRGTGVYVLETQMAVAGVVMMTDHGHGSIREAPAMMTPYVTLSLKQR